MVDGGSPCQNKTLIKSFSYSDQFNVHSFIFVGPKETSGFKVSFPQGTRLRLKVLSARECINWVKYDKNDLIGQIN